MLASGVGPNPAGCRIHPKTFYLERLSAFQQHVTLFDQRMKSRRRRRRLDGCVKMQNDAWHRDPPTPKTIPAATSAGSIISSRNMKLL